MLDTIGYGDAKVLAQRNEPVFCGGFFEQGALDCKGGLVLREKMRKQRMRVELFGQCYAPVMVEQVTGAGGIYFQMLNVIGDRG